MQNWYAQQCDGDWEHEWGVEIAMLDNPGWNVSIGPRPIRPRTSARCRARRACGPPVQYGNGYEPPCGTAAPARGVVPARRGVTRRVRR
ncbi:Imm53 family immunity protein [Streptomyces tauricus]|uniref:Imm53 family immunity protein n=1 Tax=Streptomyces tauricus TaxID=68274 RepID=UPI0033B31420